MIEELVQGEVEASPSDIVRVRIEAARALIRRVNKHYITLEICLRWKPRLRTFWEGTEVRYTPPEKKGLVSTRGSDRFLGIMHAAILPCHPLFASGRS